MADQFGEFRQIDLVKFVEDYGYKRDATKTAKKAGADQVMRRESDDDKLLVQYRSNGWVWCSCRNWNDHGSIIDFVRREKGCGFVEAIRHLRGKAEPFFSHTSSSNPITPNTASDDGYRSKTAAVWAAASRIAAPAYLRSRGLSPATLSDPRFLDTFRVDASGNVIFPHRDRSGMCGYELRRDGFKAFGAGTKKGLWLTNGAGTADCILIVESAIDAMSHAELHGGDSAYCSLSGTPSNLQKDLLIGLMIKADIRGAAVYSAFDNDAAGRALDEVIQQLTPIRRDRLIPVAGDWNEDLKTARRNRRSTAPAMRRSAA